MPLSRLYEKPRSATKVRSFPVKVSTMDAEMKFDDIEMILHTEGAERVETTRVKRGGHGKCEAKPIMDVRDSLVHLSLKIPRRQQDAVIIKLKAHGKDLFELTCRTLGLRETWYFGLQYINSKGDTRWLRHDKKILDQDIPASEGPRSFSFLVKFFPEDVSEIIQEITQRLFFLQVKQSILNGDIYCPPEATVLLASYAVQAKYGDYDEATYQPEMLATEDMLPQRVIDQYQMTPEMWADKIKLWYTDFQGMQSTEAELEYLKIAQDLEMYGISYFQIRNKRNVELWLGVSALGLFVYDQDNRLAPKVSFRWNEIKNISYNDKKFVIKMIDKKSLDFIFIAPKLKINKMILELCVGNHAMYMKRRKPDSMEVQQMKVQAREEKARKQMERDQLLREKQLREEAQREKEELQQRMHELQEQFHAAQEAMVRSEEAADLLAEKVRVAEEESHLLMRKASEAEMDKQRIQLAAIKTEEEKILIEKRAREAEIIASRIVDECERRVHEANRLRAELTVARMAERAAREKYQDFMRTSSMYGNFVVAPTPSEIVSDMRSTSANVGTEYQLQPAELQDYMPTEHAEMGEMMPAADMDTLSQAIEKERVEYLEKSKHLQEQLKELRSEIEVLKVEEKHSHLDEIHDQNVLQGSSKYTTIGRSRSTSSKARIQFYEDL